MKEKSIFLMGLGTGLVITSIIALFSYNLLNIKYSYDNNDIIPNNIKETTIEEQEQSSIEFSEESTFENVEEKLELSSKPNFEITTEKTFELSTN